MGWGGYNQRCNGTNKQTNNQLPDYSASLDFLLDLWDFWNLEIGKNMDKEYKTERDNWILFRGLRREKEIIEMAKEMDALLQTYILSQGYTWNTHSILNRSF